ncbi:MAG: hypothetical protein O7C69_01805 [Gammaproteobacteria bacterium]|nr:hypothetical protein [Gammaproteobacteria bacterium]
MKNLLTAGWMIASVFFLVACSQDSDTAKEDHGEAAGSADAEIVISISNNKNEVDLVLTTESLYLQLSAEKLAEIQAEFDDERADEEDNALASAIKNMVLDNVEKFLQERIEYSLDEIESMYWDDGEIVIEVEDENFISFDDVHGDDGNILETFDEEHALEFIEAFEKIRGGS